MAPCMPCFWAVNCDARSPGNGANDPRSALAFRARSVSRSRCYCQANRGFRGREPATEFGDTSPIERHFGNFGPRWNDAARAPFRPRQRGQRARRHLLGRIIPRPYDPGRRLHSLHSRALAWATMLNAFSVTAPQIGPRPRTFRISRPREDLQADLHGIYGSTASVCSVACLPSV